MRFTLGHQFGAELAKILGMDPNLVRGIQITTEPDEVVTVTISRFISEGEAEGEGEAEAVVRIIERYRLITEEEFQRIQGEHGNMPH
jgi:hypothetical protein